MSTRVFESLRIGNGHVSNTTSVISVLPFLGKGLISGIRWRDYDISVYSASKTVRNEDIDVDIPEGEKWLHQNKEAYVAVCEGLLESARGEVRSLGSFAQYADL